MANDISNRLTIEAGSGQIITVMTAIRGPDFSEAVIDFNRIIPMPEVLKNTGSGSTTIDDKRVDAWWTDNSLRWDHPDRKPDRLLTNEETAAIASTGFNNWYDWSVANWGTRWNAYSQNCSGDNVIRFQTADAAPLPVLAALAAQHPEARFTLEYADENVGSNAGIVVYEHGEPYSETFLGRRAAAKLWFELTGNDPKERGYDTTTFEYVGDRDQAA